MTSAGSRRGKGRNNIVAALLALALFAGVASCSREQSETTLPPSGVLHSLDDALDLAEQHKRPVFAHFTAEWCAPCRQLREQVYPSPDVAERLQRFIRVELDVDQPSGKKAARTFRAQSVPVLMVFSPSGEELPGFRVLGYIEPARLAGHLDRALARVAKMSR